MSDGLWTPGMDSGLNVGIEVYDSEIPLIESVLERLNQKQGKGGVNLEAFRKEIIERFAGIGFVVTVKLYTTNQEDLYVPVIEINGRTEKKEFDPDRMVHEVTNDILELGEGGVIKTEATDSGISAGGKHHHHGSGGHHH